ncbi:MAG: hypothetical protein WBB30_06210 [Solirubrobacterales bacterium]
MSKHRRTPSPALVISLIALFVALGSGAYAASKIGTSDLKKNAVTTPKIAKDAVKSSKVENGKLKGKDLEDGAVRASKLGSITEVSETTTAPLFTIGTATATCPAGTRVLSGGFNTDSNAANQGLAAENRRVGNGWRVSIFATASNGLTTGIMLTVYAYCLEDGD